MPSLELIQEIDRQLTVCNACRYCEGYCAVFPAMELRRTFDEEDIVHLANLCFDCRACYNACPYTPPHDYAINIPAVMSQARVETYREFSAPRLLSKLFGGNTLLVGLTVAIAVLLTFGSVLVIQGEDILFKADGSEGSFFRIVPYYAMVLPAMLLSVLLDRHPRPRRGEVLAQYGPCDDAESSICVRSYRHRRTPSASSTSRAAATAATTRATRSRTCAP